MTNLWFQSERAIKEMIEEDSSMQPDSRGSQMALVPSTMSGTSWSKEDENNSSDPQVTGLLWKGVLPIVFTGN